MSKPIFDLPVPVPGQTTKQLLDTEANRVFTLLWAALLSGADQEVVEALVDQVEAIRDESMGAKLDALTAQLNAEMANIAAQLALTETQSARDSSIVNADVFVDTAAGLGATSVGDQFQVVGSDEVVRYRHDAGPEAVEVSRIKNATAIEREIAKTKSVVPASRLPQAGVDAFPIVIGQNGRADLWLTPDGIDGRFARVGAVRMPLSGGRLPLEMGADGQEIIGLVGGAVYSPGDLIKTDVFLDTALGHQQVFARTVDPDTLETLTEQITFSQQGDLSAPWLVDSGLIRASSDHDSVYERGAVGFRRKLAAAGKLRLLIVHGQSNAVGATSGIAASVPAEVITTQPPFPGRLLMFNGGVMPHQDGVDSDSRETPIASTQYGSVVDAQEGVGSVLRESLSVGASEVLAGPWGFDGPVLVFNCGHGASGFYDLVEDEFGVKQVPWENIETLVAAAESYAAAQTLDLEIVGVIYNQGESDLGKSDATWADMMSSLRTRTDDLAVSIGQTTPIPLLLCQVGLPRLGTGLASPATVGSEIAARTLPNTFCAPIYFADIGDFATVHYPSTEHRLIGEYCGKIIADIWHGVERKHLHAVSAVRLGRTVQVTMSETIAIDRFGVIDPGNAGISYSDSSGAIGISGLRALGDTLQITLLAQPSGTDEVLSIACDNAKNYPAESGYYGLGRRYGQRSCIRATAPRGWSQTTARPFWEWAAHQRIDVTV